MITECFVYWKHVGYAKYLSECKLVTILAKFLIFGVTTK